MSRLAGTVAPRAERAQLAVASLLAAGLLWGTTWMPLKYFGSQGLSGPTLTMLSYGLIGLAAAPWVVFRRARWWPQRGLVLTMALAGGAANVCFISALVAGEVVRVMLLFYLAPIWGVLGGRVFLGEAITWVRTLAVVAAVSGALLILGGPQALAAPLSLVDALALASGLLYAAQNIATRAADTTPLDVKSLVIFVGCGAISGAIVFATGEQPPPVSGVLFAQLTGFAGFWIMAAMVTTVWGVTHLEAGRAAVLLVFELVAATVSAVWIGGERLTGTEWIGALLITAAALLEARAGPRPVGKPACAKC
jgi:drug/metabolite transporter (DMT)-like permease